jgi:hypothetical protein
MRAKLAARKDEALFGQEQIELPLRCGLSESTTWLNFSARSLKNKDLEVKFLVFIELRSKLSGERRGSRANALFMVQFRK